MKSRYIEALGAILVLSAQVTATCNNDNCLRAFQGQSSSATSFCATWNGVTSSLPTYVSACSYLPSRISSACSCVVTSTSSTSQSSTGSTIPLPPTCPTIATITSITTVSVPAGTTTLIDDSTTTDCSTLSGGISTTTLDVSFTSTTTSFVTLPPVTLTVTSIQGLPTCSCPPTPPPIQNPSFEELGTAWSITSSESNVTTIYASEYDGAVASSGSFFLVASIPQSGGNTETVQVSQTIDLCSGEGRYVFSVDIILLSPFTLDSACYVTAIAYQGTTAFPTPLGSTIIWSSGQMLAGSSWSTITFGVPYVNSGPSTGWTVLAEIQCFINPGVVQTGIVSVSKKYSTQLAYS